jgi:glutaredoxin 3
MSLIDFYIDSNRVCVFSKTTCGFCNKAKQLLETCNIKSLVYDLDTMQEGQHLHQQLISKTNHNTVPNIFINGTHIGGYSELENLFKSGKLSVMIQNLQYICSFCGKTSKTKDLEACKCFHKYTDDWGMPY